MISNCVLNLSAGKPAVLREVARVSFTFIASYPVWSTIIIAVDVLVIYALTVHGHEIRRTV